jgi:trans-2-enoyl-CoA reductase
MMPVNLRTCPECGAQKIKKDKDLVHTEFAELAKPKVPEHLRKPFSQMSRQELEEFADFKKYKKGWVYKQLQLRSK